MKVKVTFKMPDVIFNTIRGEMIDKDSDEAHAIQEVMKQYLKYGENLTVEFDTEAKTCTALKTS